MSYLDECIAKNLPNFNKIMVTTGVDVLLANDKANMVQLHDAVYNAYKEQPDTDYEGGNDKSFFAFTFCSTKLWAVANEVNGLTVMLPEEY